MINNEQGIIVLSLFDGMSCGQIALRELGIKVKTYYASEVDAPAIQTTNLNFPNTIQLGDVRNVHGKDLPKIDLLIGGSPCQGFSFCGKRLNFDDHRSRLFFEFVRVLNEVMDKNPGVLFLFENVKMKRQQKAVISEFLGLQPVEINSALVSAQNRVRLYWTNIRTRKVGIFQDVYTDILQPADRGLLLKDILQDEAEERFYMSEAAMKKAILYSERNKAAGNGFKAEPRQPQQKASCVTVKGTWRHDLVIVQRGHGYNKGGIFERKSPTLTKSSYEHNNYIAERKVIGSNISLEGSVRRLTPAEAARLQTVPDWYKWPVKETNIYKILGNGWTVEVIKHIFSFIKIK